ncbi:MAG: THUMP-like domain-containing protein [Flavobacteriaceae bacterium]
MNKHILNTDTQCFIKSKNTTDISSLLLKKVSFPNVSHNELAEQIEARNKCEKKLPHWYKTNEIYYPNKLNIEQTSSEKTASYKAEIVSGKRLIDLTGGFGIDCFYFSKKIDEITHCEINTRLSEIVKHNYSKLNCNNITTIASDGISYLIDSSNTYDWIYIDPSRRHDLKGKVFLLNDCLPNVPEHLNTLFNKAKNILIKTSPLLDIKNGVRELQHVKEIHIVAVKNDVKELLFILEHSYEGAICIKTTNIVNDSRESFQFNAFNELSADYDYPKKYLYEPNSAILKSGGFSEIAIHYKLFKLQQHSHLYTSEELKEFPGRTFKIIETIPYNKNKLKKRFKNLKANITTRNFPKTVAILRKELQLKDGGDTYLFFTTDKDLNKIVLWCSKV